MGEVEHGVRSLTKYCIHIATCFVFSILFPSLTLYTLISFSLFLFFLYFPCSNILFREFSLVSMWRVPAVPIGAHTVLSFLAEPLKQLLESSDTLEDVSQNLKEFHDWVCFIFMTLSW